MAEGLFDASKFLPYDPSQEPIFPSELQVRTNYIAKDLWMSRHFLGCLFEAELRTQKTSPYGLLQLNDKYDAASLVFKSARTTWYRPTELKHLLELKQQHPDARLVVGNTEVGKCPPTTL